MQAPGNPNDSSTIATFTDPTVKNKKCLTPYKTIFSRISIRLEIVSIYVPFYAKGEFEKKKLMSDVHIDTVVDALKTRKTVLQIEANSGHFSNLRVMPHIF